MATAVSLVLELGPDSNGTFVTPSEFDSAGFEPGWRYELLNGAHRGSGASASGTKIRMITLGTRRHCFPIFSFHSPTFSGWPIVGTTRNRNSRVEPADLGRELVSRTGNLRPIATH